MSVSKIELLKKLQAWGIKGIKIKNNHGKLLVKKSDLFSALAESYSTQPPNRGYFCVEK